MRELFSQLGGWPYLVSEFMRVAGHVVSQKVLLRHVPELSNGGKTKNNLPVHVQLLGGDPDRMAESALIACSLGAPAIDINFGCPAPTVNRHDGGATLLKYPERIKNIVKAVREAVPKNISVSAKLRLGWDNINDIHKNADAAVDGGADFLTIHGRTRMQGYAPPAHWEPIGEVRARVKVPVVANGDINTLDDFKRCRDVTGCHSFMIGRGALANPNLHHQILFELGVVKNTVSPSYQLSDWLPLLLRFAEICKELHPFQYDHYTLHRMKQWLRTISQKNPQCDWFEKIRRTQTTAEAFAALGNAQE